LYHEDTTNVQFAAGASVVGKQVILVDFLAFFHAFPDTFTWIENLFEDDEWAIRE
jgi:hypothetical protein